MYASFLGIRALCISSFFISLPEILFVNRLPVEWRGCGGSRWGMENPIRLTAGKGFLYGPADPTFTGI